MAQDTKIYFKPVGRETAPVTSFKVGKWYRLLGSDWVFVLYTHQSARTKTGYGFTGTEGSPRFDNSICINSPEFWCLATREEIEQCFLKEAARRGFKALAEFTAPWLREYQSVFKVPLFNTVTFNKKQTVCYINSTAIFHTGEWATVIKNPEPRYVQLLMDYGCYPKDTLFLLEKDLSALTDSDPIKKETRVTEGFLVRKKLGAEKVWFPPYAAKIITAEEYHRARKKGKNPFYVTTAFNKLADAIAAPPETRAVCEPPVSVQSKTPVERKQHAKRAQIIKEILSERLRSGIINITETAEEIAEKTPDCAND